MTQSRTMRQTVDEVNDAQLKWRCVFMAFSSGRKLRPVMVRLKLQSGQFLVTSDLQKFEKIKGQMN